jgi:hypothetical protein
MSEFHGSATVLRRLLDDAEALLKHPSVALELARRGVNTSIALIVTQGLASYIEGNLRSAGEDLGTAAEEIKARLERAK